jgi:NTE family protein
MHKTLPQEADAVFEGGGVKGIAFAGAVAVAEAAGVREWKNLAGTSAGSIAACLLAVGYHADDLDRILRVEYRRFADYGFGGLPRGVITAVWKRGLAPGVFFERWMRKQVAESPLARRLGKEELTFGDLARDDFADDVSQADRFCARYRLRVIASDLTDGRMLVLPQDIIHLSRTKNGPPIVCDELGLVEAVRMSMSFPYFFTPIRLWEAERPHDIVDGGLLSNFPVWLFDSQSQPPVRPTWGFRLHSGTCPDEAPPNRSIRPPLWPFSMAKAMFSAAAEAWDRGSVARAQSVRTVDIPTGSISTLDFNLSSEKAQQLRDAGARRAREIFGGPDIAAYLADQGWSHDRVHERV